MRIFEIALLLGLIVASGWVADQFKKTAGGIVEVAAITSGQVLIAAGTSITELYDPATGTLAQTASTPYCVTDTAAVLLTDGAVSLPGGYTAAQEGLAWANTALPSLVPRPQRSRLPVAKDFIDVFSGLAATPSLLSQWAKPGVSLKTLLSHPPTWICVPPLAQAGCSVAVAAGHRV